MCTFHVQKWPRRYQCRGATNSDIRVSDNGGGGSSSRKRYQRSYGTSSRITASISPTTVHQARATTRLFASFTGNAKLDEVTPELATAFIDEMAKLHPNYGRYPGSGEKTLAELVEQYPGPPFVSNRTLNKHASTMRTLLKWASVNPNPFAGVSRKKPRISETTYLPFSNEELVALFRGLSFQVKPRFHLFPTTLPWLMAIAVFSGMRQGEICELDVEDIKSTGGVAYIDITEAKSEAGVRRVPVHSELVGIGFLNYLSNIGSGPLFPGLRPGGAGMKRSHNVAKRFPDYRRRRGIDRDRVVFHSFRKSFVHAILEARVPMNLAAQIVGHEREFTAIVYDPEGSPLSQLKEAIEAVRYEGLRLGS